MKAFQDLIVCLWILALALQDLSTRKAFTQGRFMINNVHRTARHWLHIVNRVDDKIWHLTKPRLNYTTMYKMSGSWQPSYFETIYKSAGLKSTTECFKSLNNSHRQFDPIVWETFSNNLTSQCSSYVLNLDHPLCWYVLLYFVCVSSKAMIIRVVILQIRISINH